MNKSQETTVQGTIAINSKGVGFVSLAKVGEKRDRDEDIMVQTESLNTALHGDTVEVEILKEKIFNRSQGKVTKIVNRAKTVFVGTADVSDPKAVWVVTDDKKMYTDIFLSPGLPKIFQGDKVQVEIVEWVAGKSPVGKLVKIIGKAGEHNTEMESIILEKGFDSGFPGEVAAEADKFEKNAFPLKDSDMENREDFRETLTFTIDPKDAKDFDDALSFKKLENGHYEIGVHIADVSHYVRPGTHLDDEARKRGCSVYLVDRTIPMLPHALSNGICSLNPHEDRLAFGAIFEIDDSGRVYSRRFTKTVIYSDKRFTYENAQESIDNPAAEYSDTLNLMNKIAKIYIKQNAEAGAISFEQDEVRFVLDDKGVPLSVVKKQRLDTHKMIEQYMLLANREVAQYIFEKDTHVKDKIEGLMYRIHESPNVDKIKDFISLVRALGYNLPTDKEGNVNGRDLNVLFKQVEGKPEENLIKTAGVRSMSKAIYSTENSGHFGLGFEYYTHFTSPIRRYPDLLVHRILYGYLHGEKFDNGDVAQFAADAASSTEREISASEAERASIKYKQVEYWAPRIGAELNGVISGVTEWGVYVEEDETKAEGMIRLKDMKDDSYFLDQKIYAVIGEKTGNKITLGDKVRMKLIKADLDKKSLDFELMQSESNKIT